MMDDKLSLAAVSQFRSNSLSYIATCGAMSQAIKQKLVNLELAETIATLLEVLI